MQKFSVVIAGKHYTSISLEEEFYRQLNILALEQHRPINDLITEVDKTRSIPNLSSALRLYVLRTLLQKLEEKEELSD